MREIPASAAAAALLALATAGAAPAQAAPSTAPVAATQQLPAAPARAELHFRCTIDHDGWTDCGEIRVQQGETVTVTVTDLGTLTGADFVLFDEHGKRVRREVKDVTPQSSPATMWTHVGDLTMQVKLRIAPFVAGERGSVAGVLLSQP